MARSTGQTDGRTWLDRQPAADQEYIYFMGSETCPSLRCKIYGVGNVSFTALQTCGNVSFTALQTSD